MTVPHILIDTTDYKESDTGLRFAAGCINALIIDLIIALIVGGVILTIFWLVTRFL